MSRVLIVEDEFVSRQLLMAILAKDFDVCHTVVNGREGVDAFVSSLDAQQPYDLICLDIMMPVMDGQSALKEIRKIEQDRGIGGSDLVKVLMTTALGGAKDIMDAFIRGSCDGYLSKPISRKKLDEYLKKFGLYKS